MADPKSYINYTYSQGVAPAVIEYYERALLENMRPEMVHNMDAQKRSLPLNNGKTVQFRKFEPFPAIEKPLEEGVTPAGQYLTETAFRAMVKPYGGYVSLTDEMQWYMLDNMHQETAKLLADQAALSLDTISRNALNAGSHVQYVGSTTVVNPTTRASIDRTCILTYDAIKKAVRDLKDRNVKPFADGFYHAVVHPDVVHDLTSDTMWTDVSRYYDKTPVSRYELGTIYKVKFFESTNAMVFKSKQYLYGTTASIGAQTSPASAYNATEHSITLATAITDANVRRELTGQMVYISKTVSSTETLAVACIERLSADGKTVYFRYDPVDPTTGAAIDPSTWKSANSLCIKPYGGGASDGAGGQLPVYSTLIYGQNAYGSVELGGTGRNVQIIVKEPGSAGSEDPLNQRGTIGWKVNGFCSVILQDDFIIRVESGASA